MADSVVRIASNALNRTVQQLRQTVGRVTAAQNRERARQRLGNVTSGLNTVRGGLGKLGGGIGTSFRSVLGRDDFVGRAGAVRGASGLLQGNLGAVAGAFFTVFTLGEIATTVVDVMKGKSGQLILEERMRSFIPQIVNSVSRIITVGNERAFSVLEEQINRRFEDLGVADRLAADPVLQETLNKQFVKLLEELLRRDAAKAASR